MQITATDIIKKRRELWNKNHDINFDYDFTVSVAIELLENKKLLDEVCRYPEYLIEMIFVIVDKEKNTTPFFLNDVQLDFLNKLNNTIEKFKEGKTTNMKFLVLKGRQQGFTSVITAYQLACTLLKKNFTGFTLADTSDNVKTIFQDKAKYIYNNLPDTLKPTEKYNSKTELFFEKLNSSWRINVASKEVGRSRTINFFHGSEAGFWGCLISDIQSSLGEALTKNSIQILESTANGFNEFKDLWDSNEWINCFYEWWRTKEYVIDFESKEIEEDFLNKVFERQEWIWTRLRWLKNVKKLNNNQLYWYYKKYNNYLNKEKIKQEYPCTPDEAFLNSGNCVFDTEVIAQRKVELIEEYKIKPFKQGYFDFKWHDEESKDFILDSSIKFIESPIGIIKIYNTVRKGSFYVIGGDTAGDGSDYFTGTALDNTTGKRVATLRGQIQADFYTHQMYCLGKYYNTALLSIEVNFNTYPIIELQRLKYPNQYMREQFDNISKKILQKNGWKTDGNTRPLIISEEQPLIREHPELFTDITMLDECLTFIYDENMRPDAQDGKHDDLLFSDMIAQASRWQQRVEKTPIKELEGFFTKTELEDLGYINTSMPKKDVKSKSINRRRR